MPEGFPEKWHHRIAEAGLLVRRTQFVRPRLARDTHPLQNSHAHPAYSPHHTASSHFQPGPTTPTSPLPHTSQAPFPTTTQTASVPLAFPHRNPRMPATWRPRTSPPSTPRCPRSGFQRVLTVRSCRARKPTGQILPAAARAPPRAAIKGTPAPPPLLTSNPPSRKRAPP
jgi:hypothetical protein